MKRLMGLFVLVIVLAGCSGLSSNTLKEPPVLKVSAVSETKEAILGTYCWTTECVDKVGPIDLVKEEEEIVVQKGEKIQFEQKEEHRPNKYFLTEINGEKEKEIQVSEFAFNAPTETGIYTYGFTGTWNREGKEELNGDAQYAFKLKVE